MPSHSDLQVIASIARLPSERGRAPVLKCSHRDTEARSYTRRPPLRGGACGTKSCGNTSTRLISESAACVSAALRAAGERPALPADATRVGVGACAPDLRTAVLCFGNGCLCGLCGLCVKRDAISIARDSVTVRVSAPAAARDCGADALRGGLLAEEVLTGPLACILHLAMHTLGLLGSGPFPQARQVGKDLK